MSEQADRNFFARRELRQTFQNGPRIQPDLIRMNTEEIDPKQLERFALPDGFGQLYGLGLSHLDIMNEVRAAAREAFGDETLEWDAIRGGMPFKPGTTVDQQDVMPGDSFYYGRSTFSVRIPGQRLTIGGNEVSLALGALRAYPSAILGEPGVFKLYLGYRNHVCLNLSLSSDGVVREVTANTAAELRQEVLALIDGYDPELEAMRLKELEELRLGQAQFMAMVRGFSLLRGHMGRRHYRLPFDRDQRKRILNDYENDPNFHRAEDGSISLWRLYNLYTESLKDAPFDRFLEHHTQVLACIMELAGDLQRDGHPQRFGVYNPEGIASTNSGIARKPKVANGNWLATAVSRTDGRSRVPAREFAAEESDC